MNTWTVLGVEGLEIAVIGLAIWGGGYWLLRRVFGRTMARLYLALLPLSFLWGLDFALTPWVWLAPGMVWPLFHPAMPLHVVLAHGSRPLVALTKRIWRTRPEPAFLLYQVPWLVVAGLIVRRMVFGPAPWGAGRLRAGRAPTHGSTRWRQAGELGATTAWVTVAAPEVAGLVVGAARKGGRVTRAEVGNPHAVIIGATRAGKTRRVILPTVWCLGHRGESMVLTDPKGELYGHSAEWLRSRGYRVVLLDLLKPGRGNRWNPLGAIQRAVDAGDHGEASRLAWEVGNALAVSDQAAGGSADPLWAQSAESTIAALALGTVLEAPGGMRHPATMYRILLDLGGDGQGGEAMDEWFRALGGAHPARKAYGTASLSESRTRSSIYTSTAANLRMFADPDVAWLTASSDHDPADAGRKPTAIFLLLPDEAGARRPIASLYVTQVYSALAGVARANGGRLPVPVWFLLDEFGNVGKLPGIAEKLTVSAGRGIRFVLAVQSLAQIDHVYGPKVREVVTGNCDTWLFLRAADLETAKAISDRAGTYTVVSTSVQKKAGGWGGGGTEGSVARALLTPDEVLRWPLGHSLLLQAGQYPARLPLCDLSGWRAAHEAMPLAPPTEAAPCGAVEEWVPGQAVRPAGGTAASVGTVIPAVAEEEDGAEEDEAEGVPAPEEAAFEETVPEEMVSGEEAPAAPPRAAAGPRRGGYRR